MGETSLRFHRPRVDSTCQDERTVQSIPQLIDFNAKFNTNYTFCIQAEKAVQEDSPCFLHVTHAKLKDAICSCAQWLRSSVQELVLPQMIEDGAGMRKGPPIALFLDSDINLLIHAYTLMSLGVPVLLLSARLSPVAAQHLINATSAQALIHSTRLAYKAKDILSASQKEGGGQIAFYEANDTRFWLNSTNGAVNTSKSICQPGYDGGDYDRNVLILHSSGTTGLPKPIYTSHKYLLSFVTCHAFSSEESAQRLNLSTLPLYHGYGLVTPALSMGLGKTFCIPISSANPTAASVIRLIDSVHANCLMTVPSILEEVIHDPVGVRTLAKLDFVAFGGGNMKPAVGDSLASAGVDLLNHFGATESGPLAPIFVPGPDYDWQYFRLRQDIKLRIEPKSVSHDVNQSFRLTTYPPGWDKPFEIQDQFVTSPRNPMVDFKAIGRIDSVIVLATGEKVQPAVIETMLSEQALVTAAIAFGDGRFQLGVILQPAHGILPDSIDEFKESMWPIVLEANELMDAHARITSKDAIIIVPKSVTLPRSDKGSLLRRETYTMFDREIEQVYQKLESSTQPTNGHFVLDHNRDIRQQIKDLIQYALPKWNVPSQDWTTSSDLFELGMDSLQAVELRRLLLPSTESTENIPRDFVYRNPSALKLAEAIEALYRKQEPAQSTNVRQNMVNDFVDQYSLRPWQPDLIPLQAVTSKYTREEKYVVLLTGSTGSLGCHIVAHLANMHPVQEIICLIRPTPGRDQDPHSRQEDAFRSKLLSNPPEARQKITTIQATLTLPQLGLTSEIYNSLLQRVTHVLHNGWPMDFNRRLPSFQSQFQAIQNLLKLAQNGASCDASNPNVDSRNRLRFVFVSSIAVVGEYQHVSDKLSPIPETNISDVKHTNRIGYAEAKLVCERIVERARNEFPEILEACSVRIGQMSGSQESGYWNTDEHIPALLKSSVANDALPALEGTLSWLPVNVAASSISDILLSKYPISQMSNGTGDHPELESLSPVYHLENPIRWSWDDVLGVLSSLLAQKNAVHTPKLPIAPYPSWLDRLVQLGDTTTESSNYNNLEQLNTVHADESVSANQEATNLTVLPPPQPKDTRPTVKHDIKVNSNPAYNLAEFFASDFRRMGCGSVILDTRLACAASASLREFVSIASDVAVRNEILERYVGYWRRCDYL